MTVLAERVFKEVIKVNGVIKTGPHHMTGVLMRRGGEDMGKTIWIHRQKPRREASKRTKACSPWVLDLQPLDL